MEDDAVALFSHPIPHMALDISTVRDLITYALHVPGDKNRRHPRASDRSFTQLNTPEWRYFLEHVALSSALCKSYDAESQLKYFFFCARYVPDPLLPKAECRTGAEVLDLLEYPDIVKAVTLGSPEQKRLSLTAIDLCPEEFRFQVPDNLAIVSKAIDDYIDQEKVIDDGKVRAWSNEVLKEFVVAVLDVFATESTPVRHPTISPIDNGDLRDLKTLPEFVSAILSRPELSHAHGAAVMARSEIAQITISPKQYFSAVRYLVALIICSAGALILFNIGQFEFNLSFLTVPKTIASAVAAISLALL